MLFDRIGTFWIVSFHICNEEEGSNQLNLEITKHFDWYAPDVLESYSNVCSCINVPQYVQNMSTWSINNHHNAFWHIMSQTVQ